MDPHAVKSIFGQDVGKQIATTLSYLDEETGALMPNLAESWETSDATTWLIRLRKGVAFHDGKPLTADDVAFSFERLQDKDGKIGANAGLQRNVTPIDKTEVVDDNTLRVRLTSPLAVFPSGLAEVPILPRGFDPAKPVGAGPFKFVEYVRNQHVKLSRYDSYWDKTLPYLDEIVFLPKPDEDSKISALLAGQVDLTDTIPFPRIDELRKRSDVTIFSKDAAYAGANYQVAVNFSRPPLDKVEVRQALAWAIDRQAIKDVTFGFAEIISSAIPTANWAFSPQAPTYIRQDIDKAKELLAKAGVPNGFKISLAYVTSRAEYAPIAQVLQSSWAKIGVDVELIAQELGVFQTRVYDQVDYDLGLTGGLPRWDPHYGFSDSYGSVRAYTGWTNAEYDRLALQGAADADEAKRRPIYQRMHEIVQAELPLLIVAHRFIIMAATKKVQGFVPNYRQILDYKRIWFKT